MSLEIKIYYEDTDCGGVVYYANYLKYFERARTHFLEDYGFSVSKFLQEGIRLLVVRAELDYRSPARYGEVLTIKTLVEDLRPASMTFRHVIEEREHRRLVVEGSAKLVTVDHGGKVLRLPPSLVSCMRSLTEETAHG